MSHLNLLICILFHLRLTRNPDISSLCYVTFYYCNAWEGVFPTRDVFAELVVGLLQCLDELWDAALLDQGDLVVHVLEDEVSSGACGKTLHFLVFAVEKLHQLPNALQATHLEKDKAQDLHISYVNNPSLSVKLG